MATAKYADGTSVPISQSKTEIESVLEKYGATSFAYARQEDMQVILFEAKSRRIRFSLELPALKQFYYTPSTRQRRTEKQAQLAQAAEHRRLWRALLLCIKSKLECVESGISSFENEFLAYTVTPDNRTVGEVLKLQLDEGFSSNVPMLPMPASH